MTKATVTVTELFENGLYRMTEVRTAYEGGTFVSHQYSVEPTTEELPNGLENFLPSIYIKKSRSEGKEEFKAEVSAVGHCYMNETEFETYILAAKRGQEALEKANEIIELRQKGYEISGSYVVNEFTEEA